MLARLCTAVDDVVLSLHQCNAHGPRCPRSAASTRTSPERIVTTRQMGREQSHVLTCGRGEITSPSWRLGAWLRRTVSSATVGNRSDLDTPLRGAARMRRVHRPVQLGGRVAVPRASRFRGGAHRPGSRCPGERGHRDLASPTRTRWNSLHARLARARRLGRSRPAATNRAGPKRRGMVRGTK